ncbi:MAG: hypothetical protein EP326_08440 [Deltaproteobacteria bacterium]|nr:MAG: hypothetical protein EP326_08440 [Deltaproteobacteria bacterium]
MKNFWICLLISIVSAVSAQESTEISYVCQEMTTPEAPFYISDEFRQGDLVWENFRDIGDQNKKNQYIPKGSIVYTPPEFVEKMDDSENRIPVKVLSVPSQENEDNIRNSKKRRYNSISSMVNTTGDRKRVDAGSVGWIDKKSVRKASDFTFFVTKDSPLYKTKDGVSLNDKPITLSMSDGKYDIERCCTPDSYQGVEKCFDRYKFIALGEDSIESQFFMNTDKLECGFFEDLTPIANRIVEPMISILNIVRGEEPEAAIDELELLPAYHNWSTGRPKLSRVEMVKVPLIDGQQGPFGSYHYKPDDRVNSDAYLKPTSQCAFLEVLKKHQQQCTSPGCQVHFGDAFHQDSWGVHGGHDSGECIDIRPFRKSDNTDEGFSYKWGRYDRDKTKNFISILKETGAKTIIFNDPKIPGLSRDSRGVHNDHIHVCFGENINKVQKTCREGLN